MPRLAAAGFLLLLLLHAGSAGAQAEPHFSVRPGSPAEARRPVVRASGLLADPPLRRALEAGLPLRFRLRVELWEKQLFDRLRGEQEIHLSLVQDPLDGGYALDTGVEEHRLPDLTQAESALAAALRPALRPSGGGRFYYLASLHVETLSLTDLEELRRWLRGEVRPAVQGRGSATGAVQSGVRRVLVRVIGLPTRRLEARSETFVLR